MWKQIFGQKEITHSTVHFESTATITCDKENNRILQSYLTPYNGNHRLTIVDSSCENNGCDGNCSKTICHPLIRAGKKPYTDGNGGLLNPNLLK
jgi:hypothetical protein